MFSVEKADEKLEMRLFYILSWTAIIANTIGFISNALLYGLTHSTLFIFVCAVIMYSAGIIGIVLHQSRIPFFIILCVGDFIEFPILYFIYGSYYLCYIILGIVCTTIYLRKNFRIPGISILVLLDGLFVCLKTMKPELFIGIEESVEPIALVVTFLIASISIVGMIMALRMEYEKQQEYLCQLTYDLHEQAKMDSLTSLYNRRYLAEYIDKKMKTKDCHFAIALLDIDDFKEINDNYGHLFGDETLQMFARIMQKYMVNHGIVTRFGGEEFMLVFNHTNKDEIDKTLTNISEDFKQFGLETKKEAFTFSGGVEVFYKEDEIVKLFNAADKKLYYAKHSGKHTIVYDNESK